MLRIKSLYYLKLYPEKVRDDGVLFAERANELAVCSISLSHFVTEAE